MLIPKVERGKMWWDNSKNSRMAHEKPSLSDMEFYKSLRQEAHNNEHILNAYNVKRFVLKAASTAGGQSSSSSSETKSSNTKSTPLITSSSSSAVVTSNTKDVDPEATVMDVSLTSDDLAYYVAPLALTSVPAVPTNKKLTPTTGSSSSGGSSSSKKSNKSSSAKQSPVTTNSNITSTQDEKLEINNILNVFCCIRPPGKCVGVYLCVVYVCDLCCVNYLFIFDGF